MNEPIQDFTHQQTIKIPEKAHQKLVVLAEFTKQTKSELASALLVAAIDDALDSLPEDDIEGFDGTTLRDLARDRADERYHEFVAQQGRTGVSGDDFQVVDKANPTYQSALGRTTTSEQPSTKKRQLVYVPEINPSTFLFFFSKGSTGVSYSFRQYPSSGPAIVTYAKDYTYSAEQILAMAKWRFDAPTHPTSDDAFWREQIERLNQEYLS